MVTGEQTDYQARNSAGKVVTQYSGKLRAAQNQYGSDTGIAPPADNRTPYQINQDAIMANSTNPDHIDAYKKLGDITTSINNIANKSIQTGNEPTNADITSACLDHMNNGTMNANDAATAITRLCTTDGSNPKLSNIVGAGADMAQHKNTIVNHTAQLQQANQINASPAVEAGEVETQTQNMQNYAKQATNDYETIKAQAAQDKNSLAFLNAAAIKAKTANTGTWAEDFKNYGSVLEQLGLKGLSGGANDLASLQKDLENSKDIADPTDLARLNTAIKSGDIKTPQEALSELIRIRSAYTAEGAGKFDAMNYALGAEPNTNDVNKFTAAWQANRDPEAIQFARMQPEQQKAYLSLPTTNAKSLASKMARMESVDVGVKNPDGSPKMLDMTQYVGRQ